MPAQVFKLIPFKEPPFVPVSLYELPQWTCWREGWDPKKGKYDKKPVSPVTGQAAGWQRLENQVSYADALAYRKKRGLSGIGFGMHKAAGLVGVDLDNCVDRDTGVIQPWAQKILDDAETYAEFTPSGKGVRMFCEGDLDGKSSVICHAAQVEMYVDGRYLTFTGRHIPSSPKEVRPAPKTLQALKDRVAEKEAEAAAAGKARQAGADKATEDSTASPAGDTGGGPGLSGDDSSEAFDRYAYRRSFFGQLNQLALEPASLKQWVPELFPSAGTYQDGYRVSSASLGRKLEEDISILPKGIKDFGVHDMGDPDPVTGKDRKGGRTPLDLIMEWEPSVENDLHNAVEWLVKALGLHEVDLIQMGWRGAGFWSDENPDDGSSSFDPSTGSGQAAGVGGPGQAGASGSNSAAPGSDATGDDGNVAVVDLRQATVVPDLPAGKLPPRVEKFVRTVAKALGADPAGLAGAVIAVLAGAIPDTIKLQVQAQGKKWRVAPRIWVALVGDPSAKKTPIMDAVLTKLRERDRERKQLYASLKGFWDAQSKQQKAQVLAAGGVPPDQNRLIVIDTTMEAAGEVLATSPNGVIGVYDELSGWFGMLEGRYGQHGKGQSDRTFWLKARDGGPHSFDRKVAGYTDVPNLSVTILGGIQPEPMRKIAGSGTEDGMLQRLTPIMVGSAGLTDDSVDTAAVDKDFDDLVDACLALTPGDDPLRFDAGAQKIRREMEIEHHERRRVWEAANKKKLAAAFGKQDGAFAELCIVWHAVINAGQNPLPPIVEESTARMVADFMREFLRPHMMTFYTEMLNLSDEHDRLRAVSGYILVHKPDTMNSREVQKAVWSMRNLDKNAVENLMVHLEAFGWLVRQPGPQRSNALSVWKVNPAVHVLYAEQAKEEAAARARVRDIIAKDAAARRGTKP